MCQFLNVVLQCCKRIRLCYKTFTHNNGASESDDTVANTNTLEQLCCSSSGFLNTTVSFYIYLEEHAVLSVLWLSPPQLVSLTLVWWLTSWTRPGIKRKSSHNRSEGTRGIIRGSLSPHIICPSHPPFTQGLIKCSAGSATFTLQQSLRAECGAHMQLVVLVQATVSRWIFVK